MPVSILINKPIIMMHLLSELANAGFYQTAFNELQIVILDSQDTDNDVVQSVYNAHTGLPYPDENRLIEAENLAKSIPNWATWTINDLQIWFDSNISQTQINAETSLIDAKVIQIRQSSAILALGKMIIAIRNQLWPDLPND